MLLALGDLAPILPSGFCFIADNATVIGNVELGDESSVWFGAVLRGDNERIAVGARSNVQDLCVLHTDLGFPLKVGEGCTIGHRATLHGCTIGSNTLIGMSATVLNGARIGSNCLIGAGALVTEGSEVPDNALVLGTPGRVVRLLHEHEIARQRQSAVHYVANARRFAATLRQI